MDAAFNPVTERKYSSRLPDLGHLMSENMGLLDLNRNGHVCDYETELAMTNPKIKGDAAKLVAVLDHMYSRISRAEKSDNGLDGVTVKDMNKFVKMIKTYRRLSAEDEILAGFELVDDSILKQTLTRTEAAQTGPHKMFATGDVKSITPEAPVQGALGDCYFMAALSSLAATNPGAIRNMIDGDRHGKYTVKFPGKQPVTVSAPTDQEMGVYAGSSKFGTWPAIMEKAYGYHRILSNTRDPRNHSDLVNCGAEHGSADYAGLRTLTGLPVKVMDIAASRSVSDDRVDAALKSAFSRKLPVDAGINSGPGHATTGDVFALPKHHEYSVLGYDTKSRTLTLRNPWGHCEPADHAGKPLDGKDDGIFKMALNQFRRNFDELGIPVR